MGSALKGNGSNSKWRKIRKRILERDSYTCVYCQAPANSVDHVIPKSLWRDGIDGVHVDDPSNLVSSCVPCNSRKGTKLRANRSKPLQRKGRAW